MTLCGLYLHRLSFDNFEGGSCNVALTSASLAVSLFVFVFQSPSTPLCMLETSLWARHWRTTMCCSSSCIKTVILVPKQPLLRRQRSAKLKRRLRKPRRRQKSPQSPNPPLSRWDSLAQTGSPDVQLFFVFHLFINLFNNNLEWDDEIYNSSSMH